MRWWCSAGTGAWEWTWRPYLGVWVLVALAVVAYARAARQFDPADPQPRRWAFASGLLLLWVALDWPIGALAAGYLASLHMVQFLVVALVAPPLLLLGLPAAAWRRQARSPALPALELATRPLVALVGFVVVVAVTHWPLVVDGLMGSQLGSFAIDAAWLVAGLGFWWPLVAPVPARPRFGFALKIAYLIAATVLMTAPFLYLTFTRLPVYATYELAPPIEGISKREDQQLAGILMKIGGGLVLWTGIGILFFRWVVEEDGL